MRLRHFVLPLLALLAFAGPSAAVQPAGTLAWTNEAASVYAGPNKAYDIVGEIAGEERIRVDRCSLLWCQFHSSGISGWISIANLNFGQEPGGIFSGPRLNYPSGGDGKVCFYSGRDFTGSETCVGSGNVARDLALLGLDNEISSVSIGDGVSVRVCRDRNFHSYCERIIASEGTLHGFLDNGISSWQVY